MTLGVAIFCMLVAAYAALAVRLGRWSITMPIVFVAVGFLLGPGGVGLVPITPLAEGVKQLTEVTLALLLFADAATLQLLQVRDDAALSLRLLGIGLPLTILLGALVALAMLPAEGLAFAALLGAILAPTDAALGLPIFNNPRVPVRIRRTLNVESGLNDGIATPFVALFLASAVASTEPAHGGAWLTDAVIEIVLALVVGAAVGFVGGRLLARADRHGWSSNTSKQIAVLGLALSAYCASLAVGGNGFIAAFVGGIVFRFATRKQFLAADEFIETVGTCLSVLVWAIFGAVMLPVAFRFTSDWRPIVYAVLSLTVIRMVPVALALTRSGLRPDTRLLMGWFGPRGLASVVFTLMAFLQFTEANRAVDTLVAVASWTILLSVVAHGLSAVPLSGWYAQRLARAAGPLPEVTEMPEPRSRHALLTSIQPPD
jgi:sodium/hydrogen antiporter